MVNDMAIDNGLINPDYNLGYGGGAAPVAGAAGASSFNAGSLGNPSFDFNATGGAGGAGGGGIFGQIQNLFGGGGGAGISSAFDSLGGYGGIAGGLGDLMGGITGIVGAVNAGKQQKLAQEAFDVQKGFANQNAANQATLANNTLSDRAASRQVSMGKDAFENTYGSLESYVNKNKVKTKQF